MTNESSQPTNVGSNDQLGLDAGHLMSHAAEYAGRGDDCGRLARMVVDFLAGGNVAKVPTNATEPMQKAMQRAVMLRKSMNDVWRAALSELPEPGAEDAAEVARLKQALRDIADPISAWQRDLQPGYTLDGAMCVHMANDPETYKRMAREALKA
ncbi:MAG: hypothetical protein RJA36_1643 [Pseudomonadota bacterium]|jgi:hypothetical protein